jgi:hypothetical protein
MQAKRNVRNLLKCSIKELRQFVIEIGQGQTAGLDGPQQAVGAMARDADADYEARFE